MRLIGIWIICLLLGITAQAQQRDKFPTPPRAIRLYPNPATSYIQFDFQIAIQKDTQIDIYNFLGKKVLSIPASSIKTRIDLSAFTRGIYIYQWKDKTGKIMESGKFQIEK